MDIQNNIIDVLQLYEFSMAIGKSNDYKENCDSFLKLLLARKNYNSCWIYSDDNGSCKTSYALPIDSRDKKNIDKAYLKKLFKNDKPQSFKVDQRIIDLAPSPITEGCVAVFNLEKQGLLFIHNANKEEFSIIELNQLQPVISKFTRSLETALLYEKREVLLDELEKQNQDLNDYAHMVSHDLKSPLRSIHALTVWINEDYKDKLDDAGRQNLDLIRNNVEKMESLINGILNYTEIVDVNLKKTDVNLNKVVNEIIDILHKPKHINIKKSDNLPVLVGDKYKFQQLFQNLIDNAVKYCDKNKGVIEVGFKDLNEYYQFFVKDNGKGIEEVYFNKIFKRFQKLENNNSTGIGLSIVKKIVDLYKGKIWLESKIGKGTTFYFTIKK